MHDKTSLRDLIQFHSPVSGLSAASQLLSTVDLYDLIRYSLMFPYRLEVFNEKQENVEFSPSMK